MTWRGEAPRSANELTCVDSFAACIGKAGSDHGSHSGSGGTSGLLKKGKESMR